MSEKLSSNGYIKFDIREIAEAVSELDKISKNPLGKVESFQEVERSRVTGNKSNVYFISINNDPGKMIVFKEILNNPYADRKIRGYEVKERLRYQTSILKHESYAGIYPALLSTIENMDGFFMEHISGKSSMQKLRDLELRDSGLKSMDDDFKIYRERISIMKDGLKINSRLLSAGEKLEGISIKKLDLAEESYKMKRDIINALISAPNLPLTWRKVDNGPSQVREDDPRKLERNAIGYIKKQAGMSEKGLERLCKDYMSLLINGKTKDLRRYVVNRDFNPAHIIKGRVIDVDEVITDLESSDAQEWIKNPVSKPMNQLCGENPERETIKLIKYFILCRLSDSGKISNDSTGSAGYGVIKDEMVNMDYANESNESVIASRENKKMIFSLYGKDNFLTFVKNFYLQNIRKDIRKMAVIRKYEKKQLEAMEGVDISGRHDNERQMKQKKWDWHERDLGNCFGFLMSPEGIETILRNDEETMSAITQLRNVLGYIGIQKGYRKPGIYREFSPIPRFSLKLVK